MEEIFVSIKKIKKDYQRTAVRLFWVITGLILYFDKLYMTTGKFVLGVSSSIQYMLLYLLLIIPGVPFLRYSLLEKKVRKESNERD